MSVLVIAIVECLKEQLKEARAHPGLEFEGTVYHDQDGMVTSAQGSWSHCTHNLEAESDASRFC